MNSQGLRANKSGNLLESAVKNVCIQKGFLIISYPEYRKHYYGRSDNEVLVTNFPFTSVYGHKARTEFFIESARYSLKTRIECKWQQTSGSVDEKLPYLYLNCIEAMPENHIIIIIDGEGWKKGAVEWLRNAALTKKYTNPENFDKRIEVFSLSSFLTWANNTFH